MASPDTRGLWKARWFHPFLGLIGLAAVVTVAYLDRDPLLQTITEIVLPVSILLLFLAASRVYVVRREGLASEDIGRINRWTVVGIAFVGLVEMAFRWLPIFAGDGDFLYEILGLCAVGAVAGTVVGVTNARERRRTREATELERAIETANEGIAVVDPDERYTFVNSAYAEIHGLDSSEISGTTWTDLTPESVVESERPSVLRRIEEHGSWEGRLDGLRADGECFPREVSIARTPEGGHIIVARDITEKQRQERRLRTLQEAVLELQNADTEQEVVDVSVEIAQDLIGEPLTAYFRYDEENEVLLPAGISEEGRAFVAEHEFGDQMENGKPGTIVFENFDSGEITVTHDYRGQAGPADIQAPLGTTLFVPVDDHGVLVIASATEFTVDETVRYVARILAQNMENAFDRVAYEAELELQNTRLEFLNSLLRHDVLNGMTVIRAHAQELADTVEPPRKKHAQTVVKWADNVTKLVSRVRVLLDALTSEQPARTRVINVAHGIHEEVDRLEGAYPNTAFSVDVPDDLTVVADEIVHDVIGNVVRNAAEHNPNPDAWVSVSGESASEASVSGTSKSEASRNGVVRVVVEDNGPGVPGDMKERVFRRGDTGHAKSSGSGFGLFFVDTMVTNWGGAVTVEDRPGGGARFIIELPGA